jgi:outer membrane protein assembly factor BamB
MKTRWIAIKSGFLTRILRMNLLVVRAVLLMSSALLLTACLERELVLKGERVAVVETVDQATVDPAALAEGAGLSPIVKNIKAGHPGLSAGHAGGNPELELPLKKRWTVRVGGAGSDTLELPPPVVGEGRVYVVDPTGMVSAFDVETGKPVWTTSIETKTDDPLSGISGGIVFGEDRIFVHAGGNVIAALSPDSGSVIWSVTTSIGLRGGPTALGNKAVAVTDLDGNVKIYSADSGSMLWERSGLPVTTMVHGAPSPAFSGDKLVVAGYGGDISVLEVGSGKVIWTDTLAAFNPRTPLQALGDITAHPVHDGGLIFVVSQAGQIAAYNAQSGLLLWDHPIGGISMPWVSGKTVFMVTSNGRLYALRRSDGAIRWVVELPGALPVDMLVAENSMRYIGPFVAGGVVFVISQSGTLYEFDADNGMAGQTTKLGSEIVTAPQITNAMMFVLSNNGTLTAFE